MIIERIFTACVMAALGLFFTGSIICSVKSFFKALVWNGEVKNGT
jgi:hypothetical protein